MHKVQTIPLGCFRMKCIDRISLHIFCLKFLILFLLVNQTFALEAELTNIVVKNVREDLLVDLRIKGVFANEMKESLLSGIRT